MKIEPRGKYAGIKVHLDEKEVQEILDTMDAANSGLAHIHPHDVSYDLSNLGEKFLTKLGKKVREVMKEKPNLLEPRTDEEVALELASEYESAKAKIATLKAKGDWKKVKVVVTHDKGD